MGKPYESELNWLRDTYLQALGASIEPLVSAVVQSASFPLISVGSGGAFSSAHLACLLHQHYTGKVSRPLTPLDIVTSRLDLRSVSVMFLSAGGGNSDIVAAFEDTMSREPKSCSILCLNGASKLARMAASYPSVAAPRLTSSFPKDGFLATNSLLAFSILLIRAYASAFMDKPNLPPDFDSLLISAGALGQRLESSTDFTRLWERESLLVLHGPSTSPAAIDLESKFSESGLGNVQLSDYRNFAHGRHQWLARQADRTSILAIYSKDESEIAERTLDMLPSSVPTVRLCLPYHGPMAALAALGVVLQLVGFAGRFHGVDPGRPKVSEFGRRLYNLKSLRSAARSKPGLEDMAISRKLRLDSQALDSEPHLSSWREAYSRFLSRLESGRFGAILFDYDGTLCDEKDRFSGIGEEVKDRLNRLVQAGVLIGVATGRGKSVREDLRKALPKESWHHVFIGYYNGAQIADLSADDHDDHNEVSSVSSYRLKAFANSLAKHPIMGSIATWDTRTFQVSIRPLSKAVEDLVWRIAHSLALIEGLKSTRSSHSVDILLPNVSKLTLHRRLADEIPSRMKILAIGDKGEAPGNDFELLTVPYSLSVDEVSADPETCWHVAPAGYRGVKATLAYLDCLKLSGPAFTFDISLMSNRGQRRRR